MVSHHNHCINLVPEFSCVVFCLFVLLFFPSNLPLILKDFPYGKHTANATKFFYLLHMVFIPKYLYLTSQVWCASSVSSVFCSFRWAVIKWYFGLTPKINALHAWVARYSYLFCYCLVCVSKGQYLTIMLEPACCELIYYKKFYHAARHCPAHYSFMIWWI